ncbi:hypothetical protein FQN57_003777 [Myotisia sp. PD_48]|nr:hypothetical protein FQN57_003777 [Myotisia sp. PD_48]
MPPKAPQRTGTPASQAQSSNADGSPAVPGPSGTAAGRGGAVRGRGVPRLQTLKKRAPGGSLVPLNPDGSTPKPTLKFQPKFVARKSKEEREALERLEAERQQEKISQLGLNRGRGGRGGTGVGRGRGRGGGFGFGGDRSGVNGPLGSGQSDRRGGTGFRRKRDNARRSGVYGIKKEGKNGGSASSEEDSDFGLRFSIDHINLDTDSEDEAQLESVGDIKGKAPAKKYSKPRSMKPVRVERYEHVQRTIGINTEASSNKSAELRKQAQDKSGNREESLFVEEDGSSGQDEVDEANEDDEDDDVIMGGARVLSADGLQIKAEEDDDDILLTDDIPVATDETIPIKPIRKKRTKDARSKLQTEEERQEYDRHEQDIEYMKSTLGKGGSAPKAPDTSVTAGEEKKEEDGGDEDKQQLDERLGRLFLLQFPPMTPRLIPQEAAANKAGEDSDPDIAVSGAAAPQQTTTEIKREDGTIETIQIPRSTPAQPPLVTATSSQLPRGRVGKLQVHKSGRATIDWGGISFELSKGSNVGFVQDAILLSDNVTGASTDRKVWAMSQVPGKLVVTPDWQTLLDD